jgi:crotonobetainyl-CoA hydratase
MPATEAFARGLANRVVPGGDLLDAALDLARQVRAAAPLAVAAVLEVTEATAALDVAAGFDLLRHGRLPAYQAVLGSDDAVEGPLAFTERRPPRWSGR